MMAKIVKGTTFGGVVKYILDPAKQTNLLNSPKELGLYCSKLRGSTRTKPTSKQACGTHLVGLLSTRPSQANR